MGQQAMEENSAMKVDKIKREATLLMSTNGRLDVNLFLSPATEAHLGSELFLDVLNSDKNFVPMEDILTNEILLIRKAQIMGLEVPERDLLPETLEAREIPVRVELINGDIVEGSFFVELPPYRSRLSDFLNLAHQFIYLCRDQSDMILNNTYILSVKHQAAGEV